MKIKTSIHIGSYTIKHDPEQDFFPEEKLKIQRSLLAILILMWLPTPFIGYFSHHDGLMVTTVSQLQNVIRNGGAWPFNQYGSFWAFVYALPLWNIKQEYLLIFMRLMTLVFYFTTAWLTYKIARLFGGRTFANAAVMLLLGNQVFLFDLLPWPSAVAMPLITLVSYLLLRIMVDEVRTQSRIITEVIVIGFILPMVILTRIQVGVVLFAISLLLIYFFGKKREVVIFILSFSCTIGMFFAYLASKGWLVQSLQDQLYFGSSYLRSEDNPVPIFTSLGVLTVIAILGLSKKLNYNVGGIRSRPKAIVQIGFSSFVLLVGALLIFIRRSMNPYSMYLLTIHRLWISIILGAIIYFSFTQAKKTYRAWQDHNLLDKELQMMNFLALLSIASQMQIFPLFDQMHSWWGSTPGVVVFLLIFKDRYEKSKNSIGQEKKLTQSMLLATLVLTIIPFGLQTSNLGNLATNANLRGVLLPQTSANEISTLQMFFERNISDGTRVLNLCPDPDILLKPKFVNTDSRVFIFWPEFFKIDYLKKTFQSSQPEAAVSCFSENTDTVSLRDYKKLIDNGSTRAILVDSIGNLSGHDWQIWKFEN